MFVLGIVQAVYIHQHRAGQRHVRGDQSDQSEPVLFAGVDGADDVQLAHDASAALEHGLLHRTRRQHGLQHDVASDHRQQSGSTRTASYG